MPFEYLARLLSEGKTRVDHHEERIRRLENQLSKLSMDSRGTVKRDERERTTRKEKKSQRKPRKARSVYTSEGWKIPGPESELRVRDFGRDWIIEFECPECGAVSREGVSHWNTRRANGHTKYGIYLDCKNCGWRSDLLTIRAFR